MNIHCQQDRTSRRSWFKGCSIAICWLAAMALSTLAASVPNIILIMTDDQGYQDLGCYGSPNIQTPHLDQLAREGMRFTDFYSGNSVCSPSRAALLTGCYPTRVHIPGVLFPRDTTGLHPNEITLAEMLKSAGYATTCIGKWHLGHHPDFLPTRQGFDHYFGIPYSNDMTIDQSAPLAEKVFWREGMTREKMLAEKPRKNWVPLMRDEEVVEYPCDQATLTQRYTQEAVSFIQSHQEKPFFLYLPHTMPHIPLAATPSFRGRSKGGFYGDTIEEMDAGVGQILEALKRLKLEEKTLVIYTSDNGPWNLKNGHGGSALPLRGYKFQTYEGGMRVPCIMRWPGVIPEGATCSEIIASIDLLPTLAGLAKVDLPNDRVIDGVDVFSMMRGQRVVPPRDHYFYYRGRKLEAMRKGPWKLRLAKEVELYHLGRDLSETTNLAEQELERVRSMQEAMGAFDKALRESARPAGSL
ncbi:MAG: sulfatase [Verrucomicrobiota bacterium]|nr:sulfatase [Verrucomicrobiota bacterium]